MLATGCPNRENRRWTGEYLYGFIDETTMFDRGLSSQARMFVPGSAARWH